MDLPASLPSSSSLSRTLLGPLRNLHLTPSWGPACPVLLTRPVAGCFSAAPLRTDGADSEVLPHERPWRAGILRAIARWCFALVGGVCSRAAAFRHWHRGFLGGSGQALLVRDGAENYEPACRQGKGRRDQPATSATRVGGRGRGATPRHPGQHAARAVLLVAELLCEILPRPPASGLKPTTVKPSVTYRQPALCDSS